MTHAVFYFTEDKVLKGRIGSDGGSFGGATGGFPPHNSNEVLQMRDAFVWAAGYGATSYEMLPSPEQVKETEDER